jgi:hypothetical protein
VPPLELAPQYVSGAVSSADVHGPASTLPTAACRFEDFKASAGKEPDAAISALGNALAGEIGTEVRP